MNQSSHIETSDDAVTIAAAVPPDDETVVRLVRAGRLKFSMYEPLVLAVIKRMVAAKMYRSQIADKFGVTRGVAAGLIYRAKLRLYNPAGYSPQSAIARKNQGGYKTGNNTGSMIFNNFGNAGHIMPVDSAAGQRLVKRRRAAVSCCWDQCNEPPYQQGKPYCAAHMRQSGAVVAYD